MEKWILAILKDVSEAPVLLTDDLPNIDLYMDQVLSVLTDGLKSHKREDDESIMTKTMINNYAKRDVMPPPEKKKYTKDHMLRLGLIYHLKNILSLQDIESLLSISTDAESLETVYKEFEDMWQVHNNHWHEGILHQKDEIYEKDLADNEKLLLFLLIILYDAVQTKRFAERTIDQLVSQLKESE